MRLTSSPRQRRRLTWLGVAGGLVAVVAAVIVAIPSHAPTAGKPVGNEGPAQLASAERNVRLSRADRRRIDALLDRFLPAAMERKDEALAWKLAGPEMKAGSSVADWLRGTTPVPYYAARETTFHAWQSIDVGQGYVIFNLLLHPAAGSKLAPYVFSGEVVKDHGRWLVNRLYTIAIMNKGSKKHPMAEVGPADFVGGKATDSGPTRDSSHKSRIVPVVALLSLIVLVPVLIGLLAVRRAHRWRRHLRQSERRELPALPSRYRP